MTKKQVSITIDADIYRVLKIQSELDERSVRSWFERFIKNSFPVEYKAVCNKNVIKSEQILEPIPNLDTPKEVEPLIWDPNVGEHVDRMPEDGDANARPLTPENQIRNDALAAASKKEAARVNALTPEQRAAELQAHLDEWV